jgi:hypothetical protein
MDNQYNMPPAESKFKTATRGLGNLIMGITSLYFSGFSIPLFFLMFLYFPFWPNKYGQNDFSFFAFVNFITIIFQVTLPGFILAIINKAKISRYKKNNGIMNKKNKTGNLLSTLAIIVAILFFVGGLLFVFGAIVYEEIILNGGNVI